MKSLYTNHLLLISFRVNMYVQKDSILIYNKKEEKQMFETRFGIEIEMTGITRSEAAKVVSNYLSGIIIRLYDSYDTYRVITTDARCWKVMTDGSLNCQRKEGTNKISASKDYSVELVSPILSYKEDIDTLQELVRELRKAGAFTNDSCGIHIHLYGAGHDVRSIRNFINIIASKNDLLYKALEIKPQRMRYCQRIDNFLVTAINKKKPTSLLEIEEIWYNGYDGSRDRHYHSSRYHFLNLHSFFHGLHTVELRGFNSELHAGKIRSYIVLSLALNAQALTQKQTSCKKPQEQNEKFAMRTYLNRIGLIGEDFKNCRAHLTSALSGTSAWRFGTPSLN